MKIPVLTPRLDIILKNLPQCHCFADIGTDHAYLPSMACLLDKAEYAIASDIKKGPLLRAEKTVNEYSLNDRISLRLGGGLDTLKEDEADAVAIAGMGGLVISEILKAGVSKLRCAKAIFLQPMTAIFELREFLLNNGFIIKDEFLAKENEKIYNILSVELAKDVQPYSYKELYLGKALLEKRPEHFDEYLKKHIKKLENMQMGLKTSESHKSKEKLGQISTLLEEIRGI